MRRKRAARVRARVRVRALGEVEKKKGECVDRGKKKQLWVAEEWDVLFVCGRYTVMRGLCISRHLCFDCLWYIRHMHRYAPLFFLLRHPWKSC